MVTTVQKWGNSQGLRIPRRVLDEAHIEVGEPVEVTSENGEIIVRKARRRKFDLAEMISRMPDDYQVSEEDFGKPVGREEW